MTSIPLRQSQPLDRVLAALSPVTPTGPGTFEAICPVHGDVMDRLRIASHRDGRIALDCPFGCATIAIVSVLGLTMADLRAPRLALVPADTPQIKTPGALIAEQVNEARAIVARDVRNAVRWTWPYLDALTGPLLPGNLIVVGALMGNGKSTFLGSQMDAFAQEKTPTFYIPLEVDPALCRVLWAAGRLGLDHRHVVRQDWDKLPDGSRDAIEHTLEEQEQSGLIHFATPKRITLSALVDWCRWARDEAGCRVVMLDHLHRMDFGPDAGNHRVTVTDAVRRLKDVARELDLVMIAAAQLNRSSDPLDHYVAPSLARLKETAAIAEEADVVLMLSKRLRRDLPQQFANDLRLGRITENDLAEPGVMAVTCRKHRLDGDAMNRHVLLTVANGRVVDRWRYPLPSEEAR